MGTIIWVVRPCRMRRVLPFIGIYRLQGKGKPSKESTEADGKLSVAWFSTLKMEVVCASETFGFLRTTRHYSPEDRTIQVTVCVVFYYKLITQIRKFARSKYHSTNLSIIIIARGWHNRSVSGRSAEWTQLDSTLTISI
jgi:hypothetical protein